MGLSNLYTLLDYIMDLIIKKQREQLGEVIDEFLDTKCFENFNYPGSGWGEELAEIILGKIGYAGLALALKVKEHNYAPIVSIGPDIQAAEFNRKRLRNEILAIADMILAVKKSDDSPLSDDQVKQLGISPDYYHRLYGVYKQAREGDFAQFVQTLSDNKITINQ